MKTKIIPFDKKLAEKIAKGEEEGKVICRYFDDYKPARIICWDRIPSEPIVALVKIGPYYESVYFFDQNGRSGDNTEALVLEVPDNEPQFKPFDKVLVKQSEFGEWTPRLYSYKFDIWHFCQDGKGYTLCIPYEGNEHLVGTTDKPKEE